MQFKLDENFGQAIQRLFLDRGHDCATVRDEHLAGAPDDEVLRAARNEKRVLITMDYDFSKVLRRTINEKLAQLPRDRRAKIEARAAELISEELSLQDLHKALDLTQTKIAQRLHSLLATRYSLLK